MRPAASKAAVVVLCVCAAAHAATITVTNTNDSGSGSLRETILAANANGVPDTIAFALPGTGPHTIAPASRLPDLAGVLTIDGYTQPGSAPNTRAPDQGGLDTVLATEIRGPGNGFGFVLDTNPAADVTLRGIVLSGYAPHVGGGNANTRLTLHGSFIGTTVDGTDASGRRAIPNGSAQSPQFTGGILPWRSIANNAPAVIGGFGPGDGNLIAHNCGAGIFSREARTGERFDNRGNAIHHNRGSRGANADIAPAGPSPNGAGDPDTGANNRQNAPHIVAASVAGNQPSITCRVDTATSDAAYPLRIYSYENIQSGSGALLGQDGYPAASAQLSRTIALTPPPGVRALPFVAVATDADGYSSEFSAAYDVIFQNDFD
jgi:hypothetical protein